MKKLNLSAILLMGALSFQACNSNKDSKEMADSLNKTKDTTTNAMATGGIAVDESDAEFTTKTAAGGMAEVEISKLALEKSSNADIKSFADMMVNDHGKANANLMAIASKKNITLPTALDEDHQKKYNELKAMSGTDFDKNYVAAMLDGHKKTYDMLNDEIKNAKDQELKDFATQTAPIVKTHLDAIQAMSDKMK